MSEAGEFVTMKQAQEVLGVSNYTIWRMVKEGRLRTFESGVDRRRKLIRLDDLKEIQTPKEKRPQDKS